MATSDLLVTVGIGMKSAKSRGTSVRRRQRRPVDEWMADLTYAQRQRLSFLEARLHWGGRFNRNDICVQFDVTPNHVTREITEYKSYFPKNMVYDLSKRAYCPSETFEMKFATGEIGEYFSLLKLHVAERLQSAATDYGISASFAGVADPSGRFSEKILRPVLNAMHGATGVKIAYQSTSEDEPRTRTIWPHALVWGGDRWHIRAFDGYRKNYRDFVPQRIMRASELDEPIPSDAGQDGDWETIETIEVIPNPVFSARQRAMIAEEYGMTSRKDEHVWRLQLRRCLIPYFLYRYRLDVAPSAAASKTTAPRIVLKDRALAERYKFT